MAQISITKNWADGEILLEADLDEIKSDVETFLNTTGINDDNIQNGGITGTTKIATGTVGTANLASSAVTTAKIADDAVTTAKINDLAVTTAKLAATSVTTAKIAAGAVTSTELASDAVTTAKITDANVTTAKLADGAVTPAKRSTLTQGVTSTSGSFTVTPSTGNMDTTVTGTGRPVLICLNLTGSNVTYGAYVDSATPGVDTALQLYKNGSFLTNIATVTYGGNRNLQCWVFLDTTGYSGSVTYKLYPSTANVNVVAETTRLSVVEL